jgi:hypothetical protein
MLGYWWLRHRLSILSDGYCPRLSGSAGGEEAEGHPLVRLTLAGTPGVLVELGWLPARCKRARICT